MKFKESIRKLLMIVAHKLYPYIEKEDYERGFGRLSAINRIGEFFSCGVGNRVIGPQYMIFGRGCYVGRMCRFEAISEYFSQTFSPALVVSDNVSFQDFCHIGCINSISIGEGTMIASRVYISDHFHGAVTKEDIGVPVAIRPLMSKPVKIGKNVWIGEGASILPGVTLGDNVIVGANAVVTHSFPENSVIAGCPARLIRSL